MAAQTYDQIIKDLKNKVYHPIYFLFGDEPYYIDLIAEYIENNVLSDMEKEFNQTVLYGRDVDLATITGNAKRYPMMSNYQVVIVREAQDVKDLFKKKRSGDDEDDSDADSDSGDDKDPLVQYLQKPLQSTLLVFCYKYKKPDKRTKAGKLLEKTGVVFESKKLYENKIPAWVTAYVKSKGCQIQDDAANLLAEYLGTDLAKVSNELDKLMINVPKGSAINSDHIEKNIGISKDYNVFELQQAMAKRDFVKINRIINYFGANQKNNPLVITLSTLHSYFTKVVAFHIFKGKPGVDMAAALGVMFFFVKDYEAAARTFSMEAAKRAISLLHEYDLKSKGVNSGETSENDLLKELIFKIMHPSVPLVSAD
ncbi:MAG: DNA polymerase III subunit delta [Bacteroidetes bacterium ADurb.Bin397]|jgi:DNA polymerase III subunit delta|nr:DNA polymerase III subunit delta [Bacteroidia bacterium]OQA11440.1 MAG: DNA polymerase III subunit delta [Bacteroidetes bacterium ADurb.Bin397]